jgi:hypothetical protein
MHRLPAWASPFSFPGSSSPSAMLKTSLLLLATAAISQTAAYTVDLPYHVSVQPVWDYTNSSGKILEKPLLAFFSIPYAEPPVGKLRYQFPVPPKNGKKTLLNNKDYGNVCSQPTPSPVVPQGEDCLTLSIFKPQYPSNSTEKLPVIIWTPGGAFNTGGGRGLNVPSMVGNAPQDFIGVSFNYRLGAFGFLPSSLTYRAGLLNLGLLDQKRAYDWVQEHIELFGGDPDRVTVSLYLYPRPSIPADPPSSGVRRICWRPRRRCTSSAHRFRTQLQAPLQPGHPQLWWSNRSSLAQLDVPLVRKPSAGVPEQDRVQHRPGREEGV